MDSGDLRIHSVQSVSLPEESFSCHSYLVIYPLVFVDHNRPNPILFDLTQSVI